MRLNPFTAWRRLKEERSGAALVEFALVAPVLATMVIGMVDCSLWIMARLTVERASRAGAEYAVINGYDSTSISTAVTSATTSRSGYMSSIAASPAPTQWCGCPTTSGVTPATCGTTCSGGLEAGTYVTANAQSNYSFILPWPGVTTPATINASTSVRID